MKKKKSQDDLNSTASGDGLANGEATIKPFILFFVGMYGMPVTSPLYNRTFHLKH